MDANLLLGFDERITVWLNGEPVFGAKRKAIASIDEYEIPIRLNAGTNTLTLRLENKRLAWGFFARIADDDLFQDFLRGFALEGKRQGQCLEQHDSERVDIGPAIDAALQAHGLFR